MRGDERSRPSSSRQAKSRARKLLVVGFPAPKGAFETAADRRKQVADLCKVLIELASGHPAKVSRAKPGAQPDQGARIAALTPRVRQTLQRMLAGDSEKEIGVHLGVSKHTVHVYVKALYRHFEVSSRGELLARFVENAYLNRA
jgi:DNA-binding NarL/FixJ family response regulator